MKTYSVRVNFNFKANSDMDIQRKIEYFIKELPKMEDVCIKDISTYNVEGKYIVEKKEEK
jgi:hypothetical protein